MTRLIDSLVIAMLVLTSSLAASAQTFLNLDSQPGDYVGGGTIQTYTPSDGTFMVQGTSAGIQVAFYTSSYSSFWYLDFGPPVGKTLAKGVYEGAQGVASGTPTLQVFGDGRGCNTDSGRFLISDLAFNSDGSIKRLAVDFEQHCESAPPALFGSVRFNSSVSAVSRVSVADGTVLKGEAGSNDGNVTLSLSLPSTGVVKVSYETSDGTASRNRDYSSASGTVQFQPGVTSQVVAIPILGNRTARGNRTFQVQLSSAKGAPIGDGTGTITIQDPNVPMTALAMSSQQGDYIGGGQTLLFTSATSSITPSRNYDNGVSLTTPAGGYWSADFSAPGNVALVPGAYEGAQRFPFQTFGAPGLSVDGNGRGCNTLTGRFVVDTAAYTTSGSVQSFGAEFEQHCEGAIPALFGAVAINSILRQVSVSNAVKSSGPSAVFTITLNPPSTGPVSVMFTTLDGTAVAGTDYTATSQTVSFVAGELAHTVSVPLLGQFKGKRFYGRISSPSGSSVWIGQASAAF